MQPTLRAVLLFALGLPLSLLPALVEARLWTVWLAFVAVAGGAVAADAMLGLPRRRLRVRPKAPGTLYIGDVDPLKVELSAEGWSRPVELELLCDVDEKITPVPATAATVASTVTVELPLRPLRRGTAHVHAVWARWSGPLGLVRRTVRTPVDAAIAVTPDVRAVRAAALRMFGSKEYLVGLKQEHYVGDGSEFESLLEYRPGLDHRAIDWKASARHRKLLVREYRAERNHQIVLAFDTGHLMGEPMGGVPKLDHAINAGLLLAYYGLRAGDRVGLFAFDEAVRLLVQPQGGVHWIHTLQQRSAELEYHSGETNYTLGLAQLSARLERRSLVVVLTDFVDTVTAGLMVENIERLARKHLVMFVSLRDPWLAALADAEPRSSVALQRAVVAAELLRERERVVGRLRRMGVHCVDVQPDRLSTSLLNRYLDIQRRELL